MISIIIPLYNKEKYIKKCIESVLLQSITDFEIVIVDDGSTDNSIAIIKSFKNERIHIIRQRNQGPSKARNTGLKNASGEWILFLDADDILIPGSLETFIKLIHKYPNDKCFACNFYISTNKRKRKYYKLCGNYIINKPHKAWCFNTLMPRTGASLFHCDVTNKYHFRNDLRRYEDAEWLFRVMRDYRFIRCGKIVMTYNLEGAEASKKRDSFKEDFLGNLNIHNKQFWEQVAIYQLLLASEKLYPNEYQKTYVGINSIITKRIKRYNNFCRIYISICKFFSRLNIF